MAGNSEKEEFLNTTNGHGLKPPIEEPTTPAPLQNSTYCMWTLFLSVSSVMMSTGIAVGSINSSMAILSTFYNETYTARYNETYTDEQNTFLIALTVSLMLAGGCLGAVSIQVILHFFSRKNSMILMNLTNIVSVMVLCLGGRLIPSYEAVIAGRFIMGLFSGFGMNLIPIVVSEISALERQAFYLSLIGVNLSFGGLFGLVLGFKEVLGTMELWPVLLSVSAAPSLVYIAVSPWLPETPSYLLKLGRHEDAKLTLKKLRENVSEVEIKRAITMLESEKNSFGSSKEVTMQEIIHPPYLRQLMIVIMLFIQAQLCGINGIGMYTNKIFQKAGFDSANEANIASTIVYTLQFLVALVGSGAVDRYGPRMLNIISSAVMSGSLIVLTISLATYEYCQPMAYVSVAAVAIYVLSWACGLNLTLFPMLGAFTDEATRGASFTIGGVIFWIFSWFVSFIQLYLLEWLKSFAFLPWAIFNSFFLIFVIIFIPETKGVSPSAIIAHIRGTSEDLSHPVVVTDIPMQTISLSTPLTQEEE
uniref:Solute carrier family 2, facilitated glucose transporter member 1-like n=1 Tax=Ciona intestinalis TaxID=7719 RepID=H2XK10_CIOIN|nr:solute carrier family 2, facilitated glucose transporter member 1-like [Ciona intestinalis]|eukprot:XP_026694613.1 solute carrier family 2, facilitated glucose transporter member 1-like [Ciona intestinalis]